MLKGVHRGLTSGVENSPHSPNFLVCNLYQYQAGAIFEHKRPCLNKQINLETDQCIFSHRPYLILFAKNLNGQRIIVQNTIKAGIFFRHPMFGYFHYQEKFTFTLKLILKFKPPDFTWIKVIV